MPIVLNTNASATEATFNLNQANDNLRRSIARLSSGSRITKPTDDAGGLAVAYKLRSSISRTEAALNNHQNALSYLQVQDGVLEAMGDIVDRMAELRTLASDISKSPSDVENYSKEFVELQDQLNQMKREKFNGVGTICHGRRVGDHGRIKQVSPQNQWSGLQSWAILFRD